MAGTVIVPWYATGFRGDGFEEALNEVAAVALRYGASSYTVYRAKDDRYRFQQLAHFDNHADWERFWDGPENDRLPHPPLRLVPDPGALRLVGPHGCGQHQRRARYHRDTQRALKRRACRQARLTRKPAGSLFAVGAQSESGASRFDRYDRAVEEVRNPHGAEPNRDRAQLSLYRDRLAEDFAGAWVYVADASARVCDPDPV